MTVSQAQLERIYLSEWTSKYYNISYSLALTPYKVEIKNRPPSPPSCKRISGKFQVICAFLNLLGILEALCTVKDVLKNNRKLGEDRVLRDTFILLGSAYRLMFLIYFTVNNWLCFFHVEEVLDHLLTSVYLPVRRLKIAHSRILKVIFVLIIGQILLGVVLEIGIVDPFSILTFDFVHKSVERGRSMMFLSQHQPSSWNELTASDYIICGIANLAKVSRISMTVLAHAFVLLMSTTLWIVVSNLYAILADLETQNLSTKSSQEKGDPQLVLHSTKDLADAINATLGVTTQMFLVEGLALLPLALRAAIMSSNLLEFVHNLIFIVLFGSTLYIGSNVVSKMKTVRDKWRNVASADANNKQHALTEIRWNKVSISIIDDFRMTRGFAIWYACQVVAFFILCMQDHAKSHTGGQDIP